MTQLIGPSLINVGIKGARGLVHDELAYDMRPNRFDLPGNIETVLGQLLFLPEMHDLKGGEETAITVVPSELPGNANVEAVAAYLHIGAGEEPAEPERASVAIEREGQPTETHEVAVTSAPGPRNVSVRLDHGDVFWSSPQLLTPGEHRLPDFAPQLNAYLDSANATVKPGDSIPLRFLVRSDTPGTAGIELREITHSRIQTQTWPNESDGAIQVDRNFAAAFGKVERIALDSIRETSSRRFTLTRVSLDVGGEVGNERLFGEVREPLAGEKATVDPTYSLAQPITLHSIASPLQLQGVAGFFLAEAETDVYVAVQADAEGAPAGGAPLAEGTLTLAAAEPGSQGTWSYVAFAAPVPLATNTLYRLLVKAARGRVRVGIDDSPPDYLGEVLVNRGGQRWKRLGTLGSAPRAAFLGLVHLPELDNRTAAVQVSLETEDATAVQVQPVDAGSDAQTVVFNLDSLPVATGLSIVVRCNAQGSVSIANVIQEYRPPSNDPTTKLGNLIHPGLGMRVR